MVAPGGSDFDFDFDFGRHVDNFPGVKFDEGVAESHFLGSRDSTSPSGDGYGQGSNSFGDDFNRSFEAQSYALSRDFDITRHDVGASLTPSRPGFSSDEKELFNSSPRIGLKDPRTDKTQSSFDSPWDKEGETPFNWDSGAPSLSSGKSNGGGSLLNGPPAKHLGKFDPLSFKHDFSNSPWLESSNSPHHGDLAKKPKTSDAVWKGKLKATTVGTKGNSNISDLKPNHKPKTSSFGLSTKLVTLPSKSGMSCAVSTFGSEKSPKALTVEQGRPSDASTPRVTGQSKSTSPKPKGKSNTLFFGQSNKPEDSTSAPEDKVDISPFLLKDKFKNSRSKLEEKTESLDPESQRGRPLVVPSTSTASRNGGANKEEPVLPFVRSAPLGKTARSGTDSRLLADMRTSAETPKTAPANMWKARPNDQSTTPPPPPPPPSSPPPPTLTEAKSPTPPPQSPKQDGFPWKILSFSLSGALLVLVITLLAYYFWRSWKSKQKISLSSPPPPPANFPPPPEFSPFPHYNTGLPTNPPNYEEHYRMRGDDDQSAAVPYDFDKTNAKMSIDESK